MTSELVPSPYQLVALSKLRANQSQGLLVCDGVGVGKTIAAGYIIRLHNAILNQPVVVVCPPILLRKWATELLEKFQLRTVVVDSSETLESAWEEIQSSSPDKRFRIYAMPYSILSRQVLSEAPKIGLLIFDEIHTARNRETNTYKSALALSRRSEWRVGLTATPIHNSLSDLVSECSILFPQFRLEAIEGVVNEAWQTRKTSLLHPWTTRFTKERLSIHFTRREISQETVLYPERYVDDVETLLTGPYSTTRRSFGGGGLETITRLRLAASSPAAFYTAIGKENPFRDSDPKLRLLKERLSKGRTERWLVFCEFVETAKMLSESLDDRNVLLLTGETPSDQRGSILARFNETPSSVLVMTHVGSEGLDLQTCSHLVNYDLHWNPMVLEQRIGRVDRIGQQKSSVRILNIVVGGSIDERVLRVLTKKLRLVANTFADPGSVLTANSHEPSPKTYARMVMPDERVVQQELAEAERLLATAEMTKAIPTEDYEVTSFLDRALCKFLDWPSTPSAWTPFAPWQDSAPGVQGWLRSIEARSQQLRQILVEYGS